ncbi:MoaD/ThiS family protein [Kineobactrum salinum]|uniref:RnfH family protein n=1 Tax=Kineobactrum salinum TaxID=2708301 RepID=A0A6C0U5M8_9GAMM|nr:MoaD/ThiS family protein [Kineobactrum salinum]QIB67133.1 RnfH family protein [Kineobactrum salinum]
MISIKVVVVPGTVKEVALNDGATVRDALDAASQSSEGYAIQVDGVSNATLDTPLRDGQRVALSVGAKGNS